MPIASPSAIRGTSRRLGSASPRISVVHSVAATRPPTATSSSSSRPVPPASIIVTSTSPQSGPDVNDDGNTATATLTASPPNRYAISSEFLVRRKIEKLNAEDVERKEQSHANILSHASSDMVWKNLTLQRQQVSDAAVGVGGDDGPPHQSPSQQQRPTSSNVGRVGSAGQRRRLSGGSDDERQNGDALPPMPTAGVVADLRTLAAKFAHRVDVKRANLSHLGLDVPSSFTMKAPPPTSVAGGASGGGALGRRRSNSRAPRPSSATANTPVSPSSPSRRPSSSSANRRSLTGDWEDPSPASPLMPKAAIRAPNHQIVTSLVVSSKLPVASSVTNYLVAYERQGNIDFYTDTSKQARVDLKSHVAIVDLLERTWSTLPKTKPSLEYINAEVFKWMHHNVYDHFCSADANEHVWAQIVLEDWRVYGGVVVAPSPPTQLSSPPLRSSNTAAITASSDVGSQPADNGSFHLAGMSNSGNSDTTTANTSALPLQPTAGKSAAKSTILMDRSGFDHFFFAFVDVWSQTLDVQEYLALGEQALSVIVQSEPYTGHLLETEEAIDAFKAQQRAQATAATQQPNGGSAGGGSRSHNALTNGDGSQMPSRGEGQPNSSANNSATSSAQVLVPELPWTKEMVVEAAEIRSLQAVAAAQQTTKVVEVLTSMGRSDLGVTEAKQLQGFIRVVCEVEEREEDELRRLSHWASTFVEDVTKKCWWLLAATKPTVEDDDDDNGHNAMTPPTVLSLSELQNILTLHASSVSDFSDAEGSERRAIVSSVTRLLEAVAASVAERDGGGGSEGASQLSAGGDVSETRKKITYHWKSGSEEKRKLRTALIKALSDLKLAVAPALMSNQTFATPRRMTAVPSAGSSDATKPPRPPSAPRVTVTPEERNVGLAFLRELEEMSRQADLDVARAQEETALVEFLSSELAAQRPLTALMETALGNAHELSKGSNKRQVKVGSDAWLLHIQNLARVEVGLYHVVDAIHQELQKSVGAIVDSCEATVAKALADDSGDRFNRFPMHLTQRLDEGRAFVATTCKEHRDWASTMISNLRLFSNEYFTKICEEEKKALALCRTEEHIRNALRIRDEVGAAHLSLRPASAVSGAASSRRDVELAHRQAMHAAAAEFMRKSPALQVPVGTFIRASWFAISKDKQRDTFCATHVFPLLQQRNVAWSCTLLGELTEVVSRVCGALQTMRVEVEASLSDILAEAEGLALDALARQQQHSSAAGGGWGRRRADRDVWNAAVDRGTIAHIQDTIQRLVSIPQATMTAQHEFFLRKTFEWVERRWATEADIAAIQTEAFSVKKKSELHRLDRAGGSLADVHQELNKMDDIVVEHQIKSIDMMREDEERHLQWMRDRKDMRVQADRKLRILKAVEGGNMTAEQLDQRLQSAAKEQRDSAARAVIAQFSNNVKSAKAIQQTQQSTIEALVNDVPTSIPAPPSVSTGMARWLLASNVVRRGVDGSVVATFRAHPAVEKRRALYLKSKLSNVDVLVSECTKRGAAISDAVRVQLSSKPSVYDALVLPLQGTPLIGGGTSLIELLNDLVWLNPLQYISLNHCSLGNNDVEQLSKLLAGHPTINCIDLRFNPHITDERPIVRLLDVNRSSLLIVAVRQGTGLSKAAIAEVDKSCLQCRRERTSLEQHEAILMASHFHILKTQRPTDGGSGSSRDDGKLTHLSVAAVAAQYKRQFHRQGSRGGSFHPIAALQGLVAVFVAEHQPAIEAWSELNFINALFPNWNSDRVQHVLDVFTSPPT